MTVKSPPHRKPSWMDEALRVLAIYNFLLDTIKPDPTDNAAALALLAIAQSIAARTEG